MLDPRLIFEALTDRGVTFFAGVPDSLLKDFCAYVTDHTDRRNHVVAANEGAAVALAAGHHLATGGIGLVYLQNSGQGNTVNPLVSLADPDVYAIPMLLLIGWRGEPGRPDEPQHRKQGEITLPLLETLGIGHEVLPDDPESAVASIENAIERMQHNGGPRALVVRKGTFARCPLRKSIDGNPPLSREAAVAQVVDSLGETDVVVSTTGKASRELFEHRERTGLGHGRDFLTVGSMGHASQIALGAALSRPERTVWCLDGDGALLMHMGALAVIGRHAPQNFRHVVWNNGAHDSVGGQPTAGLDIDIPAVARACGYRETRRALDGTSLAAGLEAVRAAAGPSMLEVRVAPGARPDLGRPTTTPIETKDAFMEFLAGEDRRPSRVGCEQPSGRRAASGRCQPADLSKNPEAHASGSPAHPKSGHP